MKKNLINRVLITFFIVTLINVSKSDNSRLAPTSDTSQKIDPKISTDDGRGISGDLTGYRLFDTNGNPVNMDEMISKVKSADVTFIGEIHTDTIAHNLEAMLLERTWDKWLTLSLEMFETDVQYVLDEYMTGHINEEHFLKSARSWENYSSDYRELIEFSKEKGTSVIAANAPRRYVNMVRRMGKNSLLNLPEEGKRFLSLTGEDPVIFECDDVLVAIGQDNAFDWIERDIGIEFGEWDMPVVDKITFQSSHPKIFFGGDAAWGPENIIWAAAHGHQAAISIDKFFNNQDLYDRPDPTTNIVSQKMGVHEWSYDNDISQAKRFLVPHADQSISLKDIKVEVELGFDDKQAFEEAQRCLNCDVQTVFAEDLCIECDACEDICPTDCINFIDNSNEEDLRNNLRIPALNLDQDLLVSDKLIQTQRVMVKDEDVCLHCGLCAERCPTGAWDMQTYLYEESKVY